MRGPWQSRIGWLEGIAEQIAPRLDSIERAISELRRDTNARLGPHIVGDRNANRAHGLVVRRSIDRPAYATRRSAMTMAPLIAAVAKGELL